MDHNFQIDDRGFLEFLLNEGNLPRFNDPHPTMSESEGYASNRSIGNNDDDTNNDSGSDTSHNSVVNSDSGYTDEAVSGELNSSDTSSSSNESNSNDESSSSEASISVIEINQHSASSDELSGSESDSFSVFENDDDDVPDKPTKSRFAGYVLVVDSDDGASSGGPYKKCLRVFIADDERSDTSGSSELTLKDIMSIKEVRRKMLAISKNMPSSVEDGDADDEYESEDCCVNQQK
uniref:Ell-associated factor Eaf n=1 Tax=Strongyloides stercoralis TaxID=6248 RepID=A0A0K0DUT7_STRER